MNKLTSVEINKIGYANQWTIMPYKPEQKAGAKWLFILHEQENLCK